MFAPLPAKASCRNLRSDCCAVGLYCVTITWQQMFKGSRQVTLAGVLLRMTVELRRLEWLAGALPGFF